MQKVVDKNETTLQQAVSETLKKFVVNRKKVEKYGIKDLFESVSNSKKAPCYSDRDGLKFETFRGWYYGNNPIDLKWIPAVCDVLECDIGHLFGESDCRTKDIQGIVDITGLSQKAVENLCRFKPCSSNDKREGDEEGGNSVLLEVVSSILESPAFAEAVEYYSRSAVIKDGYKILMGQSSYMDGEKKYSFLADEKKRLRDKYHMVIDLDVRDGADFYAMQGDKYLVESMREFKQKHDIR